MTGSGEAEFDLFKHVKCIISGIVRQEVIDLLKNGGGQCFTYFSDYVTHCIVGDDPCESDIIDANDLYEVPVVTSNWVILSTKCGKLLPCKGFRYGDDQLFSDMVCCLSQVSMADKCALWAMVNYYGGKCSNNVKNSTTHLIVGKSTGREYDRALSIYNENHERTYLVTPDWVVNSVKEGKRCNESLYHPRLLTERQLTNASTAYITGFVEDEVPVETSTSMPCTSLPVPSNELLEKLKQRMPWNQSSPVSTSIPDTVLNEGCAKSTLFSSIRPVALTNTISQSILKESRWRYRSVSPKQVQQRTVTKGGGSSRLLHVDTETHAKLQQMDPQQRALFVKTLLEQRQQLPQATKCLNTEKPERLNDLSPQSSQVKCQQTVSVQSHVTHETQLMCTKQHSEFKHQSEQNPKIGSFKSTDSNDTNNAISETNQISSSATVLRSNMVQHSRIFDMDKQRSIQNENIFKEITSEEDNSARCTRYESLAIQQLNSPKETIQSSQNPSCLTPRRSTLNNLDNISADRNTYVSPRFKTPFKLASSRITTIISRVISPQRTNKPDTQFFGHNSNLMLPRDKCLLGCIFFIVEYDQNGYDINSWQRIMEDNGGEIKKSYSSSVTHILCQTQKHPLVEQGLRDCKRCITADWLSDTTLKGQVRPPCLALHFPTPFSDEKPCSNLIIAYSGFEGEDRFRVKKMIDIIGAKVTSYYSSKHDILVCSRPDGDKYKKAREWGKSVVNVQWLNEILLGNYSCLQQVDSKKYQQFDVEEPFLIDYTLVPRLMAAWKIPIILKQEVCDRIKTSQQLIHKNKRQRLSNSTSILDQDEENQIFPDISLTNIDPSLSKQPCVVFSGIVNACEEEKKVWQLGGIVVKDFRKATHLIIRKPQRTFKFLCCISIIKHIIFVDWLLDSYKQNEFLDEQKYCVAGSELELTYDFSISNILKNPRRSQLFKGKTFYITPGVVPSPSALSEIIQCAGGTVDKQRKSLKQIQSVDPLTYLIITVKNDLHLITDVLRANIGVYNSEFVISALFKQKIDYSCAVKLSRSKD